MLRNRFDEAREAAGATFQFRDIRAKAATDTGDLGHAQKLLGHKNIRTTCVYLHLTRLNVLQIKSPLDTMPGLSDG